MAASEIKLRERERKRERERVRDRERCIFTACRNFIVPTVEVARESSM